MKNLKLLLLTIPFLMFSCSKGGTTTTPTPPPAPVAEASIAFTVNVDPGSGGVLAVTGAAQPIIVKVSSVLPSAGVTVTVTVTKDLDNATVFTNSVSSNSADNNITIDMNIIENIVTIPFFCVPWNCM